MPQFMKLALRSLAVVVLTASVASIVQAESGSEKRAGWRPDSKRNVQMFDVSGVYTGVTGGLITIDGLGYPMSSTAQVFLIGQGLVSIQSVPIGGRIYVSGRGAGANGSVEVVIARPLGEASERSEDRPGDVGVRNANAPK